jgi:hypothetical protein
LHPVASSPAALSNLRSFLLADHAFELHYQLIFRRGPTGRLQKDQHYTATRELFGEQNLVGLFAAQSVR